MADSYSEWSILELMGHRRLAGLVQDVELFGTRMLRIDIPSEPPVTQFYSASAIYAVTPSTEEICRGLAQRSGGPQPVHRFELPPLTERHVEADDDIENFDDSDDGPF